MTATHRLPERLAATIGGGIDYLGDETLDQDRRIHKARLAIKRARTLLRALRPEIDAAAATEIAGHLRKAAATLAGPRTVDALLFVARLAAETAPGEPEAAALAAVLDRLAAEAEAAHRAVIDIEVAAAPLRAARDIAGGLATRRSDDELLCRAMMRCYRRGRRDYRRVRASSADIEALHDWRKRVKDRLTLDRLAGQRGPDGHGMRAKLDTLQELIGLERDLGFLAERVADMTDLEPDGRAALIDHLAQMRASRLASALFLGKLAYGRPPRRFRRRLRRGIRI